ncbi:MAG: plastocyanin/azurin family copper-binding protein [Actinomycetota bacterium]
MTRMALLPTVATLALAGSACGGGHSHAGHSHRGAMQSPPLPGAREIRVEARSFAFSPAEIHLKPGETANVVLAPADILHDLTVVGVPVHVVAEPGQTAAGGLTAPDRPGRYAFVCTVPGHREAGMAGVLVIDTPA